MKIINFYHKGLTVDSDGEVHAEIDDNAWFIDQFTTGEITENFKAGDLIDAMDINEVIAHLERLGYSVTDNQ